jgi:gluconokinase
MIARHKRMILVLMGVSGAGKTTIGRLLSALTGWNFEDGDDYHSEENRRKMAAGIPLTDEDRAPWLAALHQRMEDYFQQGESVIFACSALKQQYRDQLAEGFAENEFHFVYLYAPASVIRDRIRARGHAFMNPNLLDSQMETIEEPGEAWRVSVAGSPEHAVEEILTRLKEAAGKADNVSNPR